MPNSNTPRWQKIMWFGVGLGLFLIIIILLLGVGTILWQALSIIKSKSSTDLSFTFSSIGLITLTLIRFLAVLIGAAISFTGLAISFFAYEKATNLSGTINTSDVTVAKATIATYSPGIIGMVVGTIVIACALFAKSEHEYKGPKVVTVSTVPKPVDQSPDKNKKLPNSLMRSSEDVVDTTTTTESNP